MTIPGFAGPDNAKGHVAISNDSFPSREYFSRSLLPFWKLESPSVMEHASGKYCEIYCAMEILRNRYFFFLKILQRDIKTLEKWGEKIGTIEREQRAFFAMHHCLLLAEDLSLEGQREIDAGFPGQDRRLSLINAPRSPCERIGVCVCEKTGRSEPYMDSCGHGDEDYTILLA